MKTLKLVSAWVRIKTTVVLRLRELIAYVAYLFKARSKAKNVLIFGQGRSGTTLFESLLVSSGHFKGLHEVLNTVTRDVWWPKAYVAGLGRRWSGQNVVVHVKPEHLTWGRKTPVDSRSFLEFMVTEGWTIVHIQRRDVLRQLLSKHIAKARGSFHKKDDALESISLRISEEVFLADFERRLNWLSDETKLLAGLPHHVIFYEDHLESSEHHQPLVDSLFSELDLELRKVCTPLRKISKSGNGHTIENEAILRKAFEAKGWSWTLPSAE
ncbi:MULTISPECIES: hypothetical protein [unclassified Limnobacter]|uniref:hypothetical protein n=1 Tax=unclassified Limnobacter TaxID=2630203 RepID=UPI000C448FDA|nr:MULTISPECIES: hypothetical protein [unclassified Limnobacter]MAZ08557.1 hypothetical protein [Sutterellaceae bacterium]|tara:strand:+ start:15951 stop:16757 length:807 start_codon:yes stop_codon:yes gene_type:complete